jgi:hypothetical protein
MLLSERADYLVQGTGCLLRWRGANAPRRGFISLEHDFLQRFVTKDLAHVRDGFV